MKRSRVKHRAFTLIEVLLVIAILVVLGTVSVVAYSRIKQGADKNATKLLIDQTVDAVALFQITMNKFPDSDQGLQALIDPPEEEKDLQKWTDGGGPFLKDGRIPEDPWGNELKYELLEQTGTTAGPPFRISSYGPDGQEGGDDDISNYKEETGI